MLTSDPAAPRALLLLAVISLLAVLLRTPLRSPFAPQSPSLPAQLAAAQAAAQAARAEADMLRTLLARREQASGPSAPLHEYVDQQAENVFTECLRDAPRPLPPYAFATLMAGSGEDSFKKLDVVNTGLQSLCSLQKQKGWRLPILVLVAHQPPAVVGLLKRAGATYVCDVTALSQQLRAAYHPTYACDTQTRADGWLTYFKFSLFLAVQFRRVFFFDSDLFFKWDYAATPTAVNGGRGYSAADWEALFEPAVNYSFVSAWDYRVPTTTPEE